MSPAELTPGLLDALSALVVVIDLEGTIQLFNKASERATGCRLDDVRGRILWDFIPQHEVSRLRVVVSRLVANGRPVESESHFIRKDGSRCLVSWTFSALPGEQGAARWIVGTGMEVTDDRRLRRRRQSSPEGADGSVFMSTSEIGRVLGLSPATVKRWANTGLLPAARTAGGHRRFSVAVAERLARQLNIVHPSLDHWMNVLLLPGRPLELDAELLAERSRRGSWHEVADGLDEVLLELGNRWQAGHLTVAEEHIGSARLGRALGRVCDGFPLHAGAPRVLLATVEGESHTLGLALVELCMRAHGWQTLWVGSDLPTAMLVRRIGQGDADVLAVSASVAREADELERAAQQLAQACTEARVELLVGGRGPWADPFPHGGRIRDFATLEDWIEQRERRGG
ncbi:MAG TPA: PAS domain-containing protein [Anaeromyxobacter sp.]|nr:PAS domain-containing protein [Anaeromyxobacter sp.]